MDKLISAISENNDEKIISLLDNGDIDENYSVSYDLEDFPEKVEIPLIVYASSIGNPNIVRKLKHHGFEDDGKFTSIRFIDGDHKKDLLQFLLINGEDINKINSDGHSPISYAIKKQKDLEYIEELLKKGADPNIPLISFRDDNDKVYYRNPLQVAISEYKNDAEYFEKVIKLLLLFGANPNIENNLQKNSIDIARRYSNEKMEKIFQKNIKDIVGKCNDESIVNHLLEIFKISTQEDFEVAKKKLCNCISFLRREGKDGKQINYKECKEMVDKVKNDIFTFSEDNGETHCFFRHQIPEISISEINPLTGKKIPKKILKQWYDDYENSCDIEKLEKSIYQELKNKK